jgi:LPXTG-site transpeptidase (sortase) family protein
MKDKRLIKYFIVFFVLGLLIFNWDGLSWVFNYKFVSELAQNYISKDNQNTIATKTEVNLKDIKNTLNYTEKENSIEIAKIGITAPIIMSVSSDDTTASADLKKGVIHYPESAEPGKLGQVIILGHSAPANWPHINYDWVFSKISELEKGDEIVINYNNQKFTYIVSGNQVLDKGQDTPTGIDNSKSNLLLLSCWPPGKNYKRIGVMAEIRIN